MTEDELRRKFPRASAAFISANLSGDPGARPCPVVQERKDENPKRANHRPQKEKVDGRCHATYRIAATIRISDERDRDLDGALSTLQDCVINAVGRLAEMDRIDLRKCANSFKRRGGCVDND